MREVDIQSELIRSAKKAGAKAWKLSSDFLVGVPDLMVKYTGLPAALIEVKYHPRPWTRIKSHSQLPMIPVLLSPHQKNFLKDFQAVGGLAGWLVVFPTETRGAYHLAASTELVFSETDRFDLARCIRYDKVVGAMWPVRGIIASMASEFVEHLS